MGTTTTPPVPVYDSTWLVPMMQELRLRDTRGYAATPAPQVVPGRPRLPPPPPGKGGSWLPFAGMMRESLMGADRRGIQPAVAGEIAEMQVDGLAASVSLDSNGGRKLKGNFFSAEGHNLKEHGSQPDLNRPAVLLLTGSGGSAQDQGLGMAKEYAKKGASVLSVNYGGFGDSTAPNGADNKPTEQSMFQDAQKMLQHLVDLGYDPENIIIHGYSLGAAIGGKLKEEMEAGAMTPADGSAPTPVKFRGEVIDRPMLSVAHGVTTHGMSAPIAAYARKALGTFSARRAIADSTNVDTRIVVTNDTEMGPEADALRTKLRAEVGTKGRAAVTGAATNADHLDSTAMLNTNGAAIAELIGKRRDGSTQAVASGKLPSSYERSSKLASDITSQVKDVVGNQTSMATIAADLAAAATINPGVLEGTIRVANRGLGLALDLSRNILPLYAVDKAKAESAAAGLQRSLVALVALRARLPAPVLPLDGSAPPASPVLPPALVDATSVHARTVLAKLTKAGGPNAANLAQEAAVLDQAAEIRRLGETFFDAGLVTDLANARQAIQQRRNQAKRDAAKKLRDRRAARANRRLQNGAG